MVNSPFVYSFIINFFDTILMVFYKLVKKIDFDNYKKQNGVNYTIGKPRG